MDKESTILSMKTNKTFRIELLISNNKLTLSKNHFKYRKLLKV
jgi:hypothetical protein